MVMTLAAVLLAWTLLSMGGGLIGLYFSRSEFVRAFWFMSGLWGWVDGAIVLYVLLVPPLAPSEMAPILLANAGLDVLYIVAGGLMLRASSARISGFGLAIVIQGVFLLILDTTFWRLCQGG